MLHCPSTTSPLMMFVLSAHGEGHPNQSPGNPLPLQPSVQNESEELSSLLRDHPVMPTALPRNVAVCVVGSITGQGLMPPSIRPSAHQAPFHSDCESSLQHCSANKCNGLSGRSTCTVFCAWSMSWGGDWRMGEWRKGVCQHVEALASKQVANHAQIQTRF